MYAYAHSSQPRSELNVSLHEIVFHPQHRIPLPFDLNIVRNPSKICSSRYCSQLPEHSHTGIEKTFNTFSQSYYFSDPEKWLSIFIRECIECQRNKHFNMKIQTQSFSEHAPSFKYRISMEQEDLTTLLHNTNLTFML